MNDDPLKPEDRRIWTRVARTVTPRRRKSAKPVPKADRQDFENLLRLPPETPKTQPYHANDLVENQDKGVRRGRVKIDAKVDLHDMTRAEARPALVQAVIRASNRNYRCLLVITGKGPRLEGVLRQSFRSWLEAPDIRPLIASYAPAHIRHGGSGAWYVFLKS